MVQEKKRKIDFKDGHHGGHLGFPIGSILANFDLQKVDRSIPHDGDHIGNSQFLFSILKGSNRNRTTFEQIITSVLG